MGKEIEKLTTEIEKFSTRLNKLMALEKRIKNPRFKQYVEKKQCELVDMYDEFKDMEGKAFCEEFEEQILDKMKGLEDLQNRMLKFNEGLNQQINPRPRKFTDFLDDQSTSNQKEGRSF